MRRGLLFFNTIFISFLIISSASVLPKVNSEPLVKQINAFEEYNDIIECKISDKLPDSITKGLIDFIIKIIQWIINLVQQLIGIVLKLFNVLDLIKYLISLIIHLFELILDLIEAFFSIFNPRLNWNIIS